MAGGPVSLASAEPPRRPAGRPAAAAGHPQLNPVLSLNAVKWRVTLVPVLFALTNSAVPAFVAKSVCGLDGAGHIEPVGRVHDVADGRLRVETHMVSHRADPRECGHPCSTVAYLSTIAA
jgi:hypothetical protein